MRESVILAGGGALGVDCLSSVEKEKGREGGRERERERERTSVILAGGGALGDCLSFVSNAASCDSTLPALSSVGASSRQVSILRLYASVY